jgi:hypothetical protein
MAQGHISLSKASTFVMPPKKITVPGGCTVATGHKLGDSLSPRGQKPKEKGHQSNTSGGGVGPGNHEHGDHSPAGAKEKGEDGSAGRSSKEDR